MRALLLLIALTPAAASAQKTNWENVKGLPIGAEIRVSLEGGKSYRGQLQSVTGESLIRDSRQQPGNPRPRSSKEGRNQRRQPSHAQHLHRPRRRRRRGTRHRRRNRRRDVAALFPRQQPGKAILTPVGAIIGTIVGLAWPTGLWHEVYRSK